LWWYFREHWKNHPKNSQVPMIWSACSTVQERFEKLGKVDVGANVWGRKKEPGSMPEN
jgi:hypothetical protein